MRPRDRRSDPGWRHESFTEAKNSTRRHDIGSSGQEILNGAIRSGYADGRLIERFAPRVRNFCARIEPLVTDHCFAAYRRRRRAVSRRRPQPQYRHGQRLARPGRPQAPSANLQVLRWEFAGLPGDAGDKQARQARQASRHAGIRGVDDGSPTTTLRLRPRAGGDRYRLEAPDGAGRSRRAVSGSGARSPAGTQPPRAGPALCRRGGSRSATRRGCYRS